MKARYIAVLIGLGISVFTTFYLLSLLLVTEFIDFSQPAEINLSMPTRSAQALVDMPIPEPRLTVIPVPTEVAKNGLSVTDPRLVALDENDVPRDMIVATDYTRYVDNAKLIASSADPDRMQRTLKDTGRMNGFQTVFMSQDPVASQLRSVGILNFAEIYESQTHAERALADNTSLLADRFPQNGQLKFERESNSRPPMGQGARAFMGTLLTEHDRIPVYAVIFYRKNALVGIALLGGQSDRLVRSSVDYATLLDERIRNFGMGFSA